MLNAAVDTTMKHILLMEYEYARLYINSVGLQAMVSEWAKIHSDHGVVAPDVLRSTLKPNKKYIDEVCDAARHILESTLEGLVPKNHLRQATVRTYSRVLSGLLFLLKVCLQRLSKHHFLPLLVPCVWRKRASIP